jgi:hypothetical protein
VSDGSDFSFSLNGFNWNVTSFSINDKEAKGHWKNDDPDGLAAGGDDADEESGTFHAQAGAAKTPPDDAIFIIEVRIGPGRPIHAGELFGCYFVPEKNNEYSFFDRNGQLLKDEIKSDVQFDFVLPLNSGQEWQMTADFHTENSIPVAHGDWVIPSNDRDDGADDEESGTFHAQAGGGGLPIEKASSANAY